MKRVVPGLRERFAVNQASWYGVGAVVKFFKSHVGQDLTLKPQSQGEFDAGSTPQGSRSG